MNTELYLNTTCAVELNEVEVTEGNNGYPKNLKRAVYGFENLADAQEFAADVEGEVVLLHRRDGWQLWESKGREFELIQIHTKEFGDNTTKYFPTITESEFAEHTAFVISESYSDGLDGMKDYIDKRIELWEQIQNLEDDEFIVAEDDEVQDVYKCESMSFNYDTHQYVIGVM